MMNGGTKKMQCVQDLFKQGLHVRQIAVILYGDSSKKAQSKVRAIISKMRRRAYQNKTEAQPQLNKLAQPQLNKLAQPQPAKKAQPQLSPIRRYKQIMRCLKKAETVQKGKSGETVSNWLDQDTLARQLADECYESARKCMKSDKFQDACRFMELVTRFIRLSQLAKREYDIELLKSIATENEATQ